MKSTAETILKLTMAVADAAGRGDHARCGLLLTERGDALRRLSGLHAAAGGGKPSPDVRDILSRVEKLDAELERTWIDIRDRAGLELDRIASHPKQKHGTEAPCIIDRQA